MKKEILPDFAKPYKTKGYDVRQIKNNYALFKITSKRVEGKSYPILVQKYVGIIDPEKGLLHKKTYDNDTSYLEYGLSHMISTNFNRELARSISFANPPSVDLTIKLGIIYYVHGSICDDAIKLSYIFKDKIAELIQYKEVCNIKRIQTIANKIESEMKLKFGDDKEAITALLKLVVVREDEKNPQPFYSERIIKIIEFHGAKL